MFESVCEAKVRDDDIPMAIQEQVLQLEITVNNLLFMDIPNTGDEL